MDLKKKIEILMVILVILILILIAVFWYVNNQTTENKENTNTLQIEFEDVSSDVEKIERAEYNIVSNAVTTYIQTLDMNNSRYFGQDESGNLIDIVSENEKMQFILNLLSSDYISQNNITTQNLQEFVETKEEQLIFVPIEMKKLADENISTFVTYGIVENLNYELNDEVTLIVNIDFNNRTFSIEPTTQNYDEITNIDQNMTSIEQNDNNQYSIPTLNNENIVRDHINQYKRLVLAVPEVIYEKFDETYRNERFGSLENFQNYISKNADEIKSISLDEYLVNTYEGYTQYIGRDKYDNVYIFNENSVLDFTIQLDTYTILTDNFKTTYDEGNDMQKVRMNIDRWVEMINNRDYHTAYKYLDETFRNNNFASEEAFEQYMRENFPLHYKLQVGNFEETNQTYTQYIVLTDITEESDEQIENTIIMQLKDDYDFVMSFSVQ